MTRTELFQKRIKRLEERRDFLGKRSEKYSWSRLKIFLSGLALTVLVFIFVGSLPGWIVLALSLACFSVAVHFHNKVIRSIKKYNIYIGIRYENLARLNLDWEGMPQSPLEGNIHMHPFEIDLDITGERSLHRLINTSQSIEGSELLRELLLIRKPEHEKIIRRQELVKELTPLSLFRDRLLLKSRLVSGKRMRGKRIVEWVDEEPHKIYSFSFIIAAAVTGWTFLTLFILYGLDILPSFWLIPLLLYIILYQRQSKKINAAFEKAEDIQDDIVKIRYLFQHIEKFPVHSNPHMKKFLEAFFAPGDSPSRLLHEIENTISRVIWRENPISKLVLNFLMPWDIYFAYRLVRQKDNVKRYMNEWLKLLYELEVLNSLANFGYVNPGYAFPEVTGSEDFIFKASSLGHPLIPEEEKVCNDFEITVKDEIALITGSNMSGKSTFLKTLGVNLALAYSGAPVNALSLNTSLYRLFTCIKVSDSVTDGISYFYAEVKRLKQLLDELNADSSVPVFYLIDEIFKGTNNRERLTGSRAYIKFISAKNGVGAVSTHDLELVALEKELRNLKNFHFREEVKDGRMIFDYTLRPGPCPTTNALKVMKSEGLPTDEE